MKQICEITRSFCLPMQAIPCRILPRLFHSSLLRQLTTEYKCLLKMTYIIEFLQAHLLARGLMKLHRIKIERPQRAGILCSLWLLPITLMTIVNMLRFKFVL